MNLIDMAEKYKDFKQADEFIYNEIFVDNWYRAEADELKDKFVIDIGANAGEFALFASEFNARTILAVEPNPVNYQSLLASIEKYKPVCTTLTLNKAVSSKSGEFVMMTGVGGTSTASNVATKTEDAIETISLKDLVDTYDNKDESFVLKIDVEGFEYPILLNAPVDTMRKFEFIYLELHNENKINGLDTLMLNYLTELGFQQISVKEFSIFYSNGTTEISPNKVYKFKRIQKEKISLNRDWNLNYTQLLNSRVDITCFISTKDRYFSTLPACLMGIANQTYKPKELMILDDGEFRNLQQEPIYKTIFDYLLIQGIMWYHEPGKKIGQVENHIQSTKKAKTQWIWRIDDDEVPELDVLEKLVKNIGPNVGAVGGLVLPSGPTTALPITASNAIEDIYLGINEQWFVHPAGAKAKEVDHLYSSFIYRKDIANYNTDLSPVGHREETLLTYDIKQQGYSVILDPSARTWHFRNPVGGLRSHQDVSYYGSDERVFSRKMAEWKVAPAEYDYVVIEHGLGDHFAFKSILPEFLEKYKDKKHIFFVTFPAVFEDIPGIKLGSIAEAKTKFGELNKFNIYIWMIDNKWTGDLPSAFRAMYKLNAKPSSEVKSVRSNNGDTIIISPYSFHPGHAKSYPYWSTLIPKIKSLGYKVVQIGRRGEQPLVGVDNCLWDLPFNKLEEQIQLSRGWIAVDNFLQHFINCMNPIVPGVVIWATSSPNLFGYKYNTNILKDEKYLRPDQFGPWPSQKQNVNAFEDPTKIFKKLGSIWAK